MDVRSLEHFLAVVDHGGFNRASARVPISQPALSQSIHRLEREVGIALFERLGRRAVLTDAGQALVAPARDALQAVETARQSVAAVGGMLAGSVTVAATPSTSINPLSGITAEYLRTHPHVQVRMRPAFTPEEVAEEVASGRCELGVRSTQGEREVPRGLADVQIATQEFVLVMPPGARLDQEGPVTASELAGTRFIAAQRGTYIRRLTDRTVATGAELNVVAEVGHREAALALVLAGVGSTFLPSAWSQLAEGAGATVAGLDPPFAVTVSILYRVSRLAPAAEAYLEVATAFAQHKSGPAQGTP